MAEKTDVAIHSIVGTLLVLHVVETLHATSLR